MAIAAADDIDDDDDDEAYADADDKLMVHKIPQHGSILCDKLSELVLVHQDNNLTNRNSH